MGLRPVPSPSVVLPDPGDAPIVTGSYYYTAAKYSCVGTQCGQFVANTTVVNVTYPLTIGSWYRSSLTPGYVYQPITRVYNVSSGTSVNNIGYSSCNLACLQQPTVSPVIILPSPSISVTPTKTPSVTPTPTKTPSVTPTISVTPSITATPSVTPYASPLVGINVTCSYQILDTIPTSSNSLLSNPSYGYVTGSLPSSVSSSGIFLTNGDYNLPLPADLNYVYSTYPVYPYFAYGLQVLWPGGNTNNQYQWYGWFNTPDTFVAADNNIVTSSMYIPNLHNYYPDCSLETIHIKNSTTSNGLLRNYNLRIRIYKNGYLIFDNVEPATAPTDGVVCCIGATNGGYPGYPTYHIPYGTLCDQDNIKVVYSKA
jgi:hypothetical protein